MPYLKTPLVNATWNIIRSPPGHAAWRTNVVSVSDARNGKRLESSVVGGCLWPDHAHGVVHIASIINETTADWNVQLDQPCQALAMDPNDADHLLVNNASNGFHIYESNDGGKTYHSCLNQRGSVMVAVDRQGCFYAASEGGAFRNMGGCSTGKWEPMYVRRIWRRNGHVVDKVPHDYQRINIDFAGGVAFGSDQGMFIRNGSALQLISANGDVNNNIIMHPAISQAETPGDTCIVTAIWDWSPVASWDSGMHWPSWQLPDDGASMGYFGEGGGCFGVGESKYVLCSKPQCARTQLTPCTSGSLSLVSSHKCVRSAAHTSSAPPQRGLLLTLRQEYVTAGCPSRSARRRPRIHSKAWLALRALRPGICSHDDGPPAVGDVHRQVARLQWRGRDPGRFGCAHKLLMSLTRGHRSRVSLVPRRQRRRLARQQRQ